MNAGKATRHNDVHNMCLNNVGYERVRRPFR
jgi:hypothetical protein